jgi:uncharacterized protein YecT (DUF1311 family)
LNILALILTSTNLIHILNTGPEFVRENPNNFHCDQPEVIEKALEKIRSEARDRMYVEGLSQLSTPRRSTDDLEELVDSIPIDLRVTHTKPSESAFALIECEATIEFGIPVHAMNAIRSDQRSKDVTTRGHAQLTERGILWGNFRFGVEFDERRPTIVELSGLQSPQILLSSIAITIADSDTILERRLAVVAADFYIADRDLNSFWMALSAQQRLRMRRSQREWIVEKVRTCSDVDGKGYESLPVVEKIDVLNCHRRMTEARLTLLYN